MKVRFIKQPGGTMIPADDLQVEKLTKLNNYEEYEHDIPLKQNGKLHRKIFAFFAFCTQHYYGDSEAHKDEYQLDYVRKKLTILAGYYRQVFNRDGGFEIVARSLNYEKMSPEERSDFYKRIINAAIKRVFDRTTDENTLNQLYNFF